MSRAVGNGKKRGDVDGGNDAFREWTPEPLALTFVVQFDTAALKDDRTAVQPYHLSGDTAYEEYDLSRCLVEEVSCKPIGSRESIVSCFPCSVSVSFGGVLLEPVVRNAPGGACPLHRGTTDATKVYEWSMTQPKFDDCKRFGNFTPANLAKHGSTLDAAKGGGTVTLSPHLAKLAHEHLSRGLGRTETTNAMPHEYDAETFDDLKGHLLDAVSHVACRFVDATDISVALSVNKTCDLRELKDKKESVSVLVEAKVWCVKKHID